MSGETKTHTQGEVDLLIAVARVETMQQMLLSSFTEHKAEDSEHFDNLYESLKGIRSDIAQIPEDMSKCREQIKTETLVVARNEFATITDFKVFKTWLIAGMIAGTTTGSLISSVVIFFLNVNKITGAS